jgi:hypothetical protein
LAGLPDLIAILRQNTGNAFLDIGEVSLAEGGGYPHWSAEEVALAGKKRFPLKELVPLSYTIRHLL